MKEIERYIPSIICNILSIVGFILLITCGIPIFLLDSKSILLLIGAFIGGILLFGSGMDFV